VRIDGWEVDFIGMGGYEEGWVAKKRDGWQRNGMGG
jgi:hypothetical protein